MAMLPIGVDAWALRATEWIMIVCIASSYGEKLTKSAAKGVLLSSFAQLVGETAAIAALEAAETSKVLSAPTGAGLAVAYGIKSSIAVGLIEAVGHCVLASYETPTGAASKACRVAEAIGAAADVARLANAVSVLAVDQTYIGSERTQAAISFTGDEKAAVLKDLQKKLESAQGRVKQYEGFIASDISHGRDTSQNEINLKYAIKEVESILAEIARLMK